MVLMVLFLFTWCSTCVGKSSRARLAIAVLLETRALIKTYVRSFPILWGLVCPDCGNPVRPGCYRVEKGRRGEGP